MPEFEHNDGILCIPFISETCATCRHLRNDGIGRTCDAFPDGIPIIIWDGRNDHTKPFPGDHGIQFQRIDVPK